MARSEERWYAPASFREVVTAVLSLVLMGVLVVTVVAVLSRLDSDPVTQVGPDGTTVIQRDSYARAKDFFVVVFPLFTAVVTFWLGTAVEGRRADHNEDMAQEAQTKLEAVLGATDQEVLTRARQANPRAFGEGP